MTSTPDPTFDAARTSADRRRLRPLPLSAVIIDDPFWTPRREQIRTETLWQQHAMMSRPGAHLDALSLTYRPGDAVVPHIFWESDLAKWLEAASYCLATTEDPALDEAVDEVIAKLAGAQQPDGYLNVYFTVVEPEKRFTDLRDAHELYCAGHLIEAGVAHHAATGKTALLEVVRRYADLLVATFGPGGELEGGYCGHQEIELALVKLYRHTGERSYLDLARAMIDHRGTEPYYFDLERQRRGTEGYFGSVFPDRPTRSEAYREYCQAHVPVRDQHEIVGHAVRAVYMASAITDLATEYGDEALTRTAQELWSSATDKKMYVTGGIGSVPRTEGFGADYQLPSEHGYAETCAAIGLVQWAQRMNGATGDARYVDVAERALYNGVLSGASADGTHYFYGNPLSSAGGVQRQGWFDCACCPPNLARLISELGHHAYAQGDGVAVVNLYLGGRARFDFGGTTLVVEQQTDYPRSGTVRLVIGAEGEQTEIPLALRIPAWSRPTVTLENETTPVDLDHGYLTITRHWAPGTVVELDLGLEPRRVYAHPRVADAAGRVAIQRGPVVFCAERVDHDRPVAQLSLPRDAELRTEPDERTGLVTVRATGLGTQEGTEDGAGTGLYRSEPAPQAPTDLVVVPYFSWANRGAGDMAVWLQEG